MLVPFVAVSLVDAMSKRWAAASQLMVHAVMFVLAVVSLAIYGAELTRPHTPPAFMFVVVPPVLLLLVAVVSAAGAIISGRQSR